MNYKEAEKKHTELGHRIDFLNLQADDREAKIKELREEIKEASKEIAALSASIRNKSKAIESLQSLIASADFEVKNKTREQQKLERQFPDL